MSIIFPTCAYAFPSSAFHPSQIWALFFLLPSLLYSHVCSLSPAFYLNNLNNPSPFFIFYFLLSDATVLSSCPLFLFNLPRSHFFVWTSLFLSSLAIGSASVTWFDLIWTEPNIRNPPPLTCLSRFLNLRFWWDFFLIYLLSQSFPFLTWGLLFERNESTYCSMRFFFLYSVGQAFCKSSNFQFLFLNSLFIQSFFFSSRFICFFYLFSKPISFILRPRWQKRLSLLRPPNLLLLYLSWAAQIELCSLRNAFCLPIPRFYRLMIFLFSFVLEIRLVQRLNGSFYFYFSFSFFSIFFFRPCLIFQSHFWGFCIHIAPHPSVNRIDWIECWRVRWDNWFLSNASHRTKWTWTFVAFIGS